MPETKWTDGPWTARMYAGGYGGWWDIRDDDGEIIVPSVQVEADRPERAEAIARLIAAAPALYEALRAFVDDSVVHGSHYKQYERARAALSAADGTGGV